MKLRGRPGVLVQTPFDEFYNAQLKAMIPKRDRWWNEHRTGWWIHEDYADTITFLAEQAFGAIIIVDDDGREITHEGGERLEQGRLL